MLYPPLVNSTTCITIMLDKESPEPKQTKIKIRGKQKFQCPYCTSKFSQKHNLKTHVKQKHVENFETTDFRNIFRVDEYKNCASKNSNDSQIQAKKQKRKNNLEHQNIEQEIHLKKKSKVSFSNHWKTLLNGKLFQCQMCRFTVKKKNDILLHINEKHFESLSFENDENSLKKSDNTDEIITDVNNIETPVDNEKDGNKKLFMCNLCEYSFGNIKELTSHLSTLHEG